MTAACETRVDLIMQSVLLESRWWISYLKDCEKETSAVFTLWQLGLELGSDLDVLLLTLIICLLSLFTGKSLLFLCPLCVLSLRRISTDGQWGAESIVLAGDHTMGKGFLLHRLICLFVIFVNLFTFVWTE